MIHDFTDCICKDFVYFFISSGIPLSKYLSLLASLTAIPLLPLLFWHPSAISLSSPASFCWHSSSLLWHPSAYQVSPLPILKTNFKGKAFPILKTTPSIPGQPPSHSKDIHSCVFEDTINFSISKIRWLTTISAIIRVNLCMSRSTII